MPNFQAEERNPSAERCTTTDIASALFSSAPGMAQLRVSTITRSHWFAQATHVFSKSSTILSSRRSMASSQQKIGQ